MKNYELRQNYGSNSFQFVKALLFYCYFSNEFFQDKSTVEICEVIKLTLINLFHMFIRKNSTWIKKYTLKLAKKVYAFDSIAVADAYKLCSKALTINKLFSSTQYFEYAQKALKIASEFYASNNPKLMNYEICFGNESIKWHIQHTSFHV